MEWYSCRWCTDTKPRDLIIAANRPTPLYYVFGDLRVLTPVEVLHYTGHAERRHDGAYRLVNTRQAHHFDTVFGRALPLRAAS